MLELFLWGLGGAIGVMILLWLLQLFTKEPAVADIGWSLNVAALSLLYFIAAPGDGLHKSIALIMGSFWGCRLAGYVLFARILGKQKDLRYQDAQKSWSAKAGVTLFLWFVLQGILAALFSLPFLFASFSGREHLNIAEMAGFFVWIIAFAGECLSDEQLSRFKADPANRGEVCRKGLWNYSRHPNYFFEVLVWTGAALFAAQSPYGSLAWICPLIVSFFIFRVSGIPMTEARALQSKGDKYRDYQRTTSMFIPWFPKKHSEGSP
jgi:steroid 5-alpha reductase family enzyme